MLTDAEKAATNEALAAALAAVQRAEADAAAEQGAVGRFFWPSSKTTAARGLRSGYDVLLGIRQFALESTDDEHEAALDVVEHARHLADPALFSDLAASPATVGQFVDQEVAKLGDRAKDLLAGLPGVGSDLVWYAKAAGVLVVLVVVGYALNAFARVRRAS